MDIWIVLKLALLLSLIASWLAVAVCARRWRAELLLASVGVLLAAVAAECAVRMMYPQFDYTRELFIADEKLGWRFKPQAHAAVVYPGEAHHYVRINSAGFRDTTRAEFGSGSKRIAIIGDSFTSNLSVPEEYVFTTLLERQLVDTEMLNLGVNGYSQVQELLLLAQVLPEYAPDLLVVMVYLRNDPVENVNKDWTAYRRPYAELSGAELKLRTPPLQSMPQAEEQQFDWRLQRYSQLYHFVYTRLRWLSATLVGRQQKQLRSELQAPELYLCRKKPAAEIEKAYQIQEQMLLRLKARAEAAGVPVLFALAPSMVQVHDKYWQQILHDNAVVAEEYDLRYPNKRLAAFAQENDLTLIDLLPALREAAAGGEELYFPLEQHWNRAGNSIVASVLLGPISRKVQ